MEVVEILGGWVNIYKWIEVNGSLEDDKVQTHELSQGQGSFLVEKSEVSYHSRILREKFSSVIFSFASKFHVLHRFHTIMRVQ